VALLAVSAQMLFSVGVVPVTVQSLVVFVVLLVLEPGEASGVIGVYLLVGMMGLPVGAGFSGGIGWLLGPTGGFLIGFYFSALLTAAIRRVSSSFASKRRTVDKAPNHSGRNTAQIALDIFICVAAMLVYYCFGVAWLMLQTDATLSTVLGIAVLPFIVPDVIKLVVAVVCAQALRPVISELSQNKSQAN
jgi:biotin transport system substrate-specific component